MCEAVLCEQLQDLKHKHEAAKKAAREAKKMPALFEKDDGLIV